MQTLFTEQFQAVKVLGFTTAGTSTVATSIVDLAGFDGIVFLASLGTSATNNGVKVTEGNASNLGDAADLAGSKTLLDGTATQVVTDVCRPPKRYVEAQVLRGTSTTIEAVWAILYRGRTLPPTGNATTAQLLNQLLNPVEGTA
jgi:hypothetical protein